MIIPEAAAASLIRSPDLQKPRDFLGKAPDGVVPERVLNGVEFGVDQSSYPPLSSRRGAAGWYASPSAASKYAPGPEMEDCMPSLARSIGLSIGIILAVPPVQAAGAPRPFDLDGDGRIARKEFIKGRAARFDKYDRNRDQMISAADFPAASRADPLSSKVERSISSADMNRDGKVTRDELDLSGTPLFDRADADGNGIVEKAEIGRFKAQLLSPR